MSDEGTQATAVARREASTSIGQRARGRFDVGQMELIRATVAKECTVPEFGMFLELAARYELDPFAREIWAVKMQGRMTILVARDGLLAIANRSTDFIGIEGDVVREHDDFRKQSGEALPQHSYGASTKERGDITGAWATVFRAGRKPTYFFAPFEEYMPTGRKLNEHSPWNFQTSAMILKCAEAMALRKAYSLTGIVAEEEMGNQKLVNGATSEVADSAEVEWGDDECLAEWLRQLVDAVNDQTPGTWRPAKLRATLKGRSQEEREAFAEKLVGSLTVLGMKVPVRPTESDLEGAETDTDAEPGEIIQDAEIVDEGAGSAEADEAARLALADAEDEPPADYVPSTEPDADEIPFAPEDATPLPGQETLDGLTDATEG